ncbi:MAG: DotU family type IV/VI secretion system protein [Myxococcales bacterium]
MKARAKRPRLEDFDDLGDPAPEPGPGPVSQINKRKGVGGGDPAVAQRLHEAVRPCLTTVLQIHSLKRDRKPPPETAQPHMRQLLATTMSRLEALNLSHEELQDLRYGLVAFIDEFMQADPGRLREFWQANLLQLEFFGETRAGEGFFERLEHAKAENRQSVMRVYYLCLLFGFQGIYGQHGELERENLIESLKDALGQRSRVSPTLSPHGDRPGEAGVDRTRNRLLQWLAVAAASMAVIWYFGLLFTIDAQEHTLSDDLQGAYEDVKAGIVSPGR